MAGSHVAVINSFLHFHVWQAPKDHVDALLDFVSGADGRLIELMQQEMNRRRPLYETGAAEDTQLNIQLSVDRSGAEHYRGKRMQDVLNCCLAGMVAGEEGNSKKYSGLCGPPPTVYLDNRTEMLSNCSGDCNDAHVAEYSQTQCPTEQTICPPARHREIVKALNTNVDGEVRPVQEWNPVGSFMTEAASDALKGGFRKLTPNGEFIPNGRGDPRWARRPSSGWSKTQAKHRLRRKL